jgi:SAM-dependent methyltransferase
LSSLNASFRDPDGVVFLTGERVIRAVDRGASPGLSALLNTPAVNRLVTEGRLIESRKLTEDEGRAALMSIGVEAPPPSDLILEHPRVPFPTFPYEWCPEMLHAAGELTIELALALHKDGLGLKDATPYNVLFRGNKPVFVDVASVEQRDRHDPTWLPYAQFVRTFLLPLLVNRHVRVPLSQVFLTHREGVEPEMVYDMLGFGRRWLPCFLFTVSIPTWLARRGGSSTKIYERRTEAPDKASFIFTATLGHLRRQLQAATPVAASSRWSAYMETKSYRNEDFEAKEAFVRSVLDAMRPATVLDVGCNTGHFSALAARCGADVVSIDSDATCVGETYRRAAAESLSILPLVADIARPSPSLGWRNGEQSSLLDRLSGRFELVMMLAVLHHLVVTERIPLTDVLDLAADLTTDRVILEYVGPGDPMFKRLVRGRDQLYARYSTEWFEEACRARFEILECQTLASLDRRLYLLKKRAA